jgi:CheY-like chemotaxis protein
MSGFDGLIVGLTGNALDDNVDIFLHAGADCVIAKPFRAAQMDALIQHTKVHGMKSQTSSKFRLETTLDQTCVMRFL